MARAHVSGARISVSANLVEKCRIKIHDIGHSSWVLHCLAVVENRECSESSQFKCSHSMAAFWCYTFTKSNYTIENHRHCTMSMGSKNSGRREKAIRVGIATGVTCARRPVYQMVANMLTKYWIAKWVHFGRHSAATHTYIFFFFFFFPSFIRKLVHLVGEKK